MHLTISNLIEIAAVLLGGGGLAGGAKGISRVTRLVVAVENAVKVIEAIIIEVKNVQGTLNAHTVMLAEHGQKLQYLQQQQQQTPPSVTVVPMAVPPAAPKQP